MLLRRNSRPAAYVVAWDISDGAVLWITQGGGARTTFVTEVDGEPVLSGTFKGFVV